MAEYANRATKELIMTLAGWVAWAEKLSDAEFRNSKKARRSVKAMHNHATKALDAVVEGLDIEQLESCKRFVKCSELAILPQNDPRAEKEYYVIPVSTFHELMDDVISDCAFCDKEDKDAKRCPRRRSLINAGVIPRDFGGGCPFMGGVDW